MPIYQACALVCEVCQAEALGKIVRRGPNGTGGVDVLHPADWKVGGDKAYCPLHPPPHIERDDVTPVEIPHRRTDAQE